MEIKVNDYVRTDKGEIGKVSSVMKENLGFGNIEACNTEPYVYGTIIKSSPRIIDLICVGDYVNGLKVQGVNNEIKGFGTIIFSKDSSIMEDYIYSIVTKEMFEQMEYKVGE